MYLEENQSEIKRRLGDAYNPHHTVSLSLDITLEQERWMNPFSVPGPYPDAPQTFFMAVHFMQGARRCARIFQFFPDWWAGKSRGMPYVQLSHSFFSVYLAFGIRCPYLLCNRDGASCGGRPHASRASVREVCSGRRTCRE